MRITTVKVYVGNLPSDIRERDLEVMFYKFGKIFMQEKALIPFAFIEFVTKRLVVIKFIIIINRSLINIIIN